MEHETRALYRWIVVWAVAGVLGMAGCSSDSDDSGGGGSDASDTYPYLTDQPEATPSTATDGDTISYTIYATGPTGLEQVSVSLASAVFGGGFDDLAVVDLDETDTDTWTGSAPVDYTGVVVETENGYWMRITLYVSADPGDATSRYYFLSEEATSLDVKMEYIEFDADGFSLNDGKSEKSKYTVVSVDIN